MFFEENAKLLREFSRVSKTAGARADYVQGGGGNTSVKLANGLMAIKASGFHSVLKTFVVHTHSVYANLAACAVNCREICETAFKDADYSWGMVPYVDPGVNLTFAIRDELRRVEKETGKTPSVIIMQNHGIIAHDDDPDNCLALHADANERLAKQFGITGDCFPKVQIKEVEEGLYEADTPYLTQALAGGTYTEQFLLEQPLYPDQMVFLIGTFAMDKETVEEGQCVANSATGKVLMRMDGKKAQVLAETLTAVVFVINNIKAAGHPLSTMGEAAKNFIANWESEKYRKSLAGKKG